MIKVDLFKSKKEILFSRNIKKVEGLVGKVDRNIAADKPGAGPIDNVLSEITKKISSIDSKIDGVAGGPGGGGYAGPDGAGGMYFTLLPE